MMSIKSLDQFRFKRRVMFPCIVYGIYIFDQTIRVILKFVMKFLLMTNCLQLVYEGHHGEIGSLRIEEHR